MSTEESVYHYSNYKTFITQVSLDIYLHTNAKLKCLFSLLCSWNEISSSTILTYIFIIVQLNQQMMLSNTQ